MFSGILSDHCRLLYTLVSVHAAHASTYNWIWLDISFHLHFGSVIAWKKKNRLKQHVYAATSGAQEKAVNFLKCMFFIIWSAAPHMYSTFLPTSLPHQLTDLPLVEQIDTSKNIWSVRICTIDLRFALTTCIWDQISVRRNYETINQLGCIYIPACKSYLEWDLNPQPL